MKTTVLRWVPRAEPVVFFLLRTPDRLPRVISDVLESEDREGAEGRRTGADERGRKG